MFEETPDLKPLTPKDVLQVSNNAKLAFLFETEALLYSNKVKKINMFQMK